MSASLFVTKKIRNYKMLP